MRRELAVRAHYTIQPGMPKWRAAKASIRARHLGGVRRELLAVRAHYAIQQGMPEWRPAKAARDAPYELRRWAASSPGAS